jgi:hypothetical protein
MSLRDEALPMDSQMPMGTGPLLGGEIADDLVLPQAVA